MEVSVELRDDDAIASLAMASLAVVDSGDAVVVVNCAVAVDAATTILSLALMVGGSKDAIAAAVIDHRFY